MPQMAPMSWTTLLVFFSLIYLFFILLNYYMFNHQNKFNKLNKTHTQKFNYKW